MRRPEDPRPAAPWRRQPVDSMRTPRGRMTTNEFTRRVAALPIAFAVLLLALPRPAQAQYESYSVPAAVAYACPGVLSTPPTPCVTDADNTSEGATAAALIASARANAWSRNGSARALGLDLTGAGGEGWMFARLSALAPLPEELTRDGVMVIVRMVGAAQSTLAEAPQYNVFGEWGLRIGNPDRTQVWSDGSNYQGAAIGGASPLLSMTVSAFSRLSPIVASGEGYSLLTCAPTGGCENERNQGPLGSGLASFERSVTIRMPIGRLFLVGWYARSLGDAMAVVDPILTIHPDHAPYVALELDGIEPPTPAPGPLDGVDIDALAARGYNVERLRELGLLEPPPSDTTPPSTSATVLPAANAAGWSNADVTVMLNAADGAGGSGVEQITYSATGAQAIDSTTVAGASASVPITAEGVTVIEFFATDVANNVEASQGVVVKLDKTPPTVTVTSPANGAVFTQDQVVEASYSCTDAGSLVATCVGPVPSGHNVDTASVGSHSFTVTAMDGAGNTHSVSNTYAVGSCGFTGFFAPVDNLPSVNAVKAGSGVPVKFRLCGDQGLAIMAPGYPISVPASCDLAAPGEEIEETLTAGSSSLSYDASADQYIYVWKTDKSWAGTCRQLILKLSDGTQHQANFTFTK